MLATNLFFSLVVAGFAIGQSSESSNSTVASFSPPLTEVTKSQWCTSQRNTCPLLCGGAENLAGNGNTCITKTLIWKCTCSDGKEPENLDQYLGTVPQLACDETFRRCNEAYPGADKCKEPACGKLDAKNVKQAPASTSSAAASSTSTAASSSTSAAAAANPSASLGAGTRFLPEMGVAAGVAAAVGLLL